MLLTILFHIYFVFFTDKPEKAAPALSPRAVEQRAKWNIPTDELDYPVAALYTDSLRRAGATIHHTSRWMNGATCEMTAKTAAKVAEWKFVKAVEMTRDDSPYGYGAKKRNRLRQAVSDDPSGTDAQLDLFNLRALHNAGFEGQGILMAVCDGGFANANTMKCFRQTQELGHFDFTDDPYDFYGSTGDHGTECLSAISGIAEGYYGAATKADYYLMRSEEYDTESPKEADNLIAALEKADSLGVNVFSVSLGYAKFDNPAWDLDKTKDLDGRTMRVSRAATIAARKGMLVCAAAGNDGDVEWRTISVPADADSILTVGAVDTDGQIVDFSSYGPSSDGRVKPEVCAVGVKTVLINPYNAIVKSNGTSFATPLLAGMAACLWSALPDKNAMQIRDLIIRSADHYTTPDPNHQSGYGIPDAWKAYTTGLEEGMDIEHIRETEPARKFIRGNQILIFRHGHIYNLAGQRIR